MENIINNSANLFNVSLDQPEKPVTINNNDDKRDILKSSHQKFLASLYKNQVINNNNDDGKEDILKFSRQKFLSTLHKGEVPRGDYASKFIGQTGIGESKYDVGFKIGRAHV